MGKNVKGALFLLVAILVFMYQPEVASAKTYKSSNKKLTATVKENKDSSFNGWREYFIQVKNRSDKQVKNWKITFTMTSKVENVKTWSGLGIKVSGSGKKIVVKPASGCKKIAAKSTILPSGAKFGFGGMPTAKIKSAKITVTFDKNATKNTSNTSKSTATYTLTGQKKTVDASQTPVGKHGALHVLGTQLVDEKNQPVILRGASTHGIQWFPQYVNKDAFQSLRDEWGVNMVRLAAYAREGGYTQGADTSMDATIEEGVKAATDLGMYVIIDWHVLAYNPNEDVKAAKQFFKKYANKYKDNKNVIFEICNEPTNTSWDDGTSNDIESYAKEIVPIIRKYTDAVIVCGTNTWSQDVDLVNPATLANKKNIMYAVHFYAGTHGQSLRDKVSKALANGTPVMCTEFGICDASGNGGYNVAEAKKWIGFFEDNGISYCCWSLCNKDESASYLKSSCTKINGGWTNGDLTTTGSFIVNTYRAYADKENGVTEKPLPAKGAKYTISGYKYKVTKSAKSGGTVKVIGSTSKKRKKVTIKATVKINGYTFKVTAVGKKAFYKYKKAKKLVIGKNVITIGKKAFSGMTKLKKVVVKSKKIKKGKKYIP